MMIQELYRPVYRTRGEETFCRERMASRQLQILKFGYVAVFIIHGLIGLFECLLFDGDVRTAMLALAFACLATGVLGILCHRHAAMFKGAMVLHYYTAGSGGPCLLYLASQVWQDPDLATLIAVVIIGLGAVSPPLFPVSHRHSFYFSIMVVVLTHFAMGSAVNSIPMTLIAAVFTAYGLLLRVALWSFLENAALAEYRFNIQIVPEHIVRHAADGSVNIQDLFRASMRFCVCISSDWRKYQMISAGMPPETLTSVLNQYYDLAHSLLKKHILGGAYFSDWIADELFVVIYGAEGVSEKQLVNTALRFGQELVAAKAGFYQRHGVPEAIDIGIAAGPALTGMMGPEGHRKATAIGEVPGRARRLQSAGKLLRQVLGEADRVIFGHEMLMRITEPFQVTPFPIPHGKTPRDLKDREIYVLEPEPAGQGSWRVDVV